MLFKRKKDEKIFRELFLGTILPCKDFQNCELACQFTAKSGEQDLYKAFEPYFCCICSPLQIYDKTFKPRIIFLSREEKDTAQSVLDAAVFYDMHYKEDFSKKLEKLLKRPEITLEEAIRIMRSEFEDLRPKLREVIKLRESPNGLYILFHKYGKKLYIVPYSEELFNQFKNYCEEYATSV